MRRQLESHSEVSAKVRESLRNGDSGAALDTLEQALKKAPQRFLVLKYEDMIGDPGSTLFRICNFCDLPFPELPLAPLPNDSDCAVPY